jgi:DNA-binding IclR family transcriptional regulator
MTASSPPTRRVVDIIEYLCERRGMPIRLSDFVQALGLNQATAHTILKELVETGWVTRDPVSKTFSVGGALVRLARQIDDSPSVAHAAHLAASAIAAETGYAASVSERAGDHLVITAFIAGGDDHWTAVAGDRVPFAAPFGLGFAAWEPPDERRAWLNRSGVTSEAFEAQLVTQLDDILGQGFSVERLSPEMASAIPIMTRIQSDALSDSMRDHLDEVLLEMTRMPTALTGADSRQGHYVGAIAAPVFNQLGRVTHNICVHPFTPLLPRKLLQIGRRLTRAAAEIEPQP